MKSNPIPNTKQVSSRRIKNKVNYKAPKKADKPYASKETNGAPDLGDLNAWEKYTQEVSRRKRWEWFVIDQFLRGNHSVKGNPNDNTITISRRNDKIDYPINKIWSTFRAVRGYVTRHKPVIDVEPTNSADPESVKTARRYNALLDRDNTLNNFPKINKEWVYYGIKYGTGYRQIGYDPQNKRAIRWSIDPFDLGIGSKVGEFDDAPYIMKSVVRTMGYLRSKFGDKMKDIGADNELAADEYKKMSLQILFPSGSTTPKTENEETKVVHECWYRVYEENKQGGLINKCTFVDNMILDFQETPYQDYPFVAYNSDVTPNEIHSEGHLKHVIAPQRMLNLLNTHALEYNHLVNRGRFMMDKNSGFKLMNTKEGQIILKNPGKQITVVPIPGLNPMLQWQIQFANEIVEDIGGQHQASMGATPSRVSSGDAIEALQTGDSNNISDLRENFEDALSQEAAWILRMYSYFEKDGVTVNNKQPDGTVDQFHAVGSEAYGENAMPEKKFVAENDDYVDAVGILPDNQVKVSVTSQLGETRQARLSLLKDLVALGMPLKILLEHLEFPNTSDILERIASEGVADMMASQMQQPPSPGGPGMPPTGPGAPPVGAPIPSPLPPAGAQ